ncbi:hypothetical protein Tco_1191693 [Tanacetum coccineum]
MTLVLPQVSPQDLSDGKSECDVPINDDSSESHFTTFSNHLFDSNDDFSSDDESLSEEEIQKDEFKIFSNPLYDLDDELNHYWRNSSNQKDLRCSFQVTGIDELLFSQDEMDLVFDDSIPPGIDDDDDSEGDILFIEPVATMENNIKELNEDESFDPGGGWKCCFKPNV